MSMFPEAEIGKANFGTWVGNRPVTLQAFDVKGYQQVKMTLSKKAYKGLLKYASHAYDALSAEEKAKQINPGVKNPVDRLNQKVHFLATIAPDFLEQTGSPFIVDFLTEKKSEKSRRLMGFQNSEGLYARTESESPQQGFINIMKLAFRKEFINFANDVKVALEEEAADPDLYKKRVRAFMDKNKAEPEADRKEPGIGFNA